MSHVHTSHSPPSHVPTKHDHASHALMRMLLRCLLPWHKLLMAHASFALHDHAWHASALHTPSRILLLRGCCSSACYEIVPSRAIVRTGSVVRRNERFWYVLACMAQGRMFRRGSGQKKRLCENENTEQPKESQCLNVEFNALFIYQHLLSLYAMCLLPLLWPFSVSNKSSSAG